MEERALVCLTRRLIIAATSAPEADGCSQEGKQFLCVSIQAGPERADRANAGTKGRSPHIPRMRVGGALKAALVCCASVSSASVGRPRIPKRPPRKQWALRPRFESSGAEGQAHLERGWDVAMLEGHWHWRMQGSLLCFQIQGHRGMLDSITRGHHLGIQQNSNPANVAQAT